MTDRLSTRFAACKAQARAALITFVTAGDPDVTATPAILDALVAGGAAFLGHLFSVWLGFRGGKGVATFLGTVLALFWPVGLIACGLWLAAAGIFRISSLSALVAAALAPIAAYLWGLPAVAAVLAFMAVLIFIRHRANIERLLAGTEPRIGRRG